MSLSHGSGYTTATGTFNTVNQKNTVLAITGQTTQNATTTVGTVGAGKVWRIIGMSFVGESAAALNTASILLNDVAVLSYQVYGTATSYCNNSVHYIGSYSDAYVLTAGQTIKTVASASIQCSHNVHYIEESA